MFSSQSTELRMSLVEKETDADRAGSNRSLKTSDLTLQAKIAGLGTRMYDHVRQPLEYLMQ